MTPLIELTKYANGNPCAVEAEQIVGAARTQVGFGQCTAIVLRGDDEPILVRETVSDVVELRNSACKDAGWNQK